MAALAPGIPPRPFRPGSNHSRRSVLGTLPLLALALAGCATVPRKLPQAIAPFSTAPGLGALPPGWEELVLRRDLPRTDYRVALLNGRRALRASGRGASGVRCPIDADAVATPVLHWSWFAREVPPGMSVDRSETDDAPARVAVAFGGEERRLSVRDRAFYELVHLLTGERLPFATLMYVWDGRLPVGTVVNYPRTSRIRYLVVESGPERARRWLRYERDVAADFRAVFGEDPGRIQSVGLMTDGDDLKVDLETWYGDVRLDAGHA